ncbi:DUF892 family protein [Pedobacter sp. V48]|nr:DUF892 family protein [Pedobacter sp. V48]
MQVTRIRTPYPVGLIHYEIAIYGTLVVFAQNMGHTEVD